MVHAAVMRVEFLIPVSRSLKAKRRVLKPLLASLGRTFPVAVAEVDHQDVWQRAAVAVAFVTGDAPQLERLIDAVRAFFDEHVEIDVLDVRLSYLEDPHE